MTEIKWPRDRIILWQEGQTFLPWFCDGGIYGSRMQSNANSNISHKSACGSMDGGLFGHTSDGHNHSLVEFGLIWRYMKI